MNDDNPYRFASDADELRASGPDERDLTPHDLKAIDVGRRVLAVLIAFSTSALVVTMAVAGFGFWAPEALNAASFLGLFCAATYPLLFLSGLQLTPHLHRRFGAFHALGLLVPGLNVFVAGSTLQDATRTLLDRRVQIGWLKSDFRDARRVPAEER